MSRKNTLLNAKIYILNKRISSIKNNNIILLRHQNMIKWLYGDTSFLPTPPAEMKKTTQLDFLKKEEDKWGLEMKKLCKNNISETTKQWTTIVGETIAKELLYLYGINDIWKPNTIEGMSPDLETDEAIFEIKTATYHTGGTANEKILGVAYKYRKVPRLYKKKLMVLCIGQAERYVREKNLIRTEPVEDDEEGDVFLNYCKDINIVYTCGTFVLDNFIKKKNEKSDDDE